MFLYFIELKRNPNSYRLSERLGEIQSPNLKRYIGLFLAHHYHTWNWPLNSNSVDASVLHLWTYCSYRASYFAIAVINDGESWSLMGPSFVYNWHRCLAACFMYEASCVLSSRSKKSRQVSFFLNFLRRYLNNSIMHLPLGSSGEGENPEQLFAMSYAHEY